MRPGLALLTVLGAAACGAALARPAGPTIDPAMPEAERRAIAAAEDRWLQAGASPSDVAGVVWVWADVLPGRCGTADVTARLVRMARVPCRGSLYVTALHELGHVLTGPEHSPDPRDVMYWRLNDEQADLTPADVARLRR